MSSPRHLWSGDWERESAAAAEELARRRGSAGPLQEQPQPTVARPRASQPRPAPARPTRARAGAWGRSLRRIRRPAPVLALILLALVATGAYAALRSENGSRANAASNAAWLGVKIASGGTTTFNNGGVIGTAAAQGGGAVVSAVIPGSPAAQAGLRAGDVITEIGNAPVSGPSDVESLMAGRRPGDTVEIGVERGLMTFTIDATLQARPPGYR